MTPDTVIMDARNCRKCGYELRGLRVGAVCPECAEPIRARRKSFGAREGTMTDADPGYVKRLRLGFVTMTLAILGSILGVIVGWFSGLGGGMVSLMAALAWLGGVWIISQPRPDPFASIEDPILDSENMRRLVRASAGAWPVFALLSIAGAALAGPPAAPGAPGAGVGLLSGVVLVLRVLAGVAAYIGLIPVCIFVGDLAFWMSDDTGGWRLRAAAWAMAIFGVVTMIGVGLAGMGLAIGNILLFGPPVIVFVAQAVFFWSVMGCVSLATWVLKYQNQVEGRGERITERLRDRTERGGTVAGSTPCLECGYELRGLPFGGRCPECGESYADRTPMPINDPAKRTPRDESPIEVDLTGPTQTIRSRDPVFGPRPAADDDSPIPLSDDPAEPTAPADPAAPDDPDGPDDWQELPPASIPPP